MSERDLYVERVASLRAPTPLTRGLQLSDTDPLEYFKNNPDSME